MSWSLLQPEALALLVVLPLLALLARRSLTDLSPPQRLLSLLVRSVLVLVLVLALARPARVLPADRACTVIAVDVSDSMTEAALSAARVFVNATLAGRRSHDIVKLITFAADARAVPLPRDGVARLARHEDGSATDLVAAAQLAYALFPEGYTPRLLFVSDGRQTRGDIRDEAERAAALGVRIERHLLDEPPPHEAGILALSAPETVHVGEPFSLRARIFATRPARARLMLVQDGAPVPTAASAERELPAGESEIPLPAVVRAAGPSSYRVELTSLSPDRFPENNAASTTVTALGRPRVLIVDDDTERVAPVAALLTNGDFDVEVRPAAFMPHAPEELARFDFVVLSDVPSERLPARALQTLERYVRDDGGGFLMAGGPGSFGPGGYEGSRMEQLLPVRLSGRRRREDASVALSLVLDCSGSMAGPKLELAREAAKAAVLVLGPDDLVEVIGFAGEPDRTVRLQRAQDRAAIAHSISRLLPQGGTQIFPALEMAYQDLAAARARVKHVILLTDGQTQESGITDLVRAMRSENITVSTVGLGTDVNRGLLQTAASLGGGRAYTTSDPNHVPRIFVDETTNVKQRGSVDEPTSVHVEQAAGFLQGIDVTRAPLLRGYVATSRKAPPAQVVLASDFGDPVLARVRVGLGVALAFTPDIKGGFTADWLRWRDFGRLLAQLVREHLRVDRRDDVPMRVEVVDSRARATIDALTSDERFRNHLTGELRLDGTRAGGDAVPMQQTAPGRYEGSLPLPGFGAFSVRGILRDEHGGLVHGHGVAMNPYPLEYAPAVHGSDSLAHAVLRTRGVGARATRMQELWPPLVLLALGMFLVDLLLRRVRLVGRLPDESS